MALILSKQEKFRIKLISILLLLIGLALIFFTEAYPFILGVTLFLPAIIAFFYVRHLLTHKADEFQFNRSCIDYYSSLMKLGIYLLTAIYFVLEIYFSAENINPDFLISAEVSQLINKFLLIYLASTYLGMDAAAKYFIKRHEAAKLNNQ
ncbi:MULTISPECIES: hypothetical protein [Deefgea]|uniref:Uncharacterized protein n=1 Tax=Deefgea chitinilytica TaxID=570276 RepID=A0ABS2CER4_9NEIS|nr:MULTISPECIES: hypothetical protein [Deefgea]MBM5572643.1 hypothetical protein [Deefgea chitinilytica]MBM9889879.1 hypothetical protein [Deefgea sp. CFH1-16]